MDLKCQVLNENFFRAPKSLTAINTCLDGMEQIKGRDMAFVSDWRSKGNFGGQTKSIMVFLKVAYLILHVVMFGKNWQSTIATMFKNSIILIRCNLNAVRERGICPLLLLPDRFCNHGFSVLLLYLGFELQHSAFASSQQLSVISLKNWRLCMYSLRYDWSTRVGPD